MRLIRNDKDWNIRNFWQRCPRVAPSGIRVLPNDELTWDFVQGHHPRSIQEFHWAAERFVWHQTHKGILEIDPTQYCAYVNERCQQLNAGMNVDKALAVINSERLTPVTACHGDMTFSNVLISNAGDITFIDPGYYRGLPCQEIDESKMLQSVDGFDMLHRGHPRPDPRTMFEIRKIHIALLATHYVRLCHHIPTMKTFALKRIREIANVL